MPSSFAQAIFDKLFVPDGKRFVVALNRDKMLFTQEVASCLEGNFGVRTYSGGSLDLRIVRETVVTEEPDAFVLFVMKEDFPLMDDISENSTFVVFQFRSLFPHYPWDAVKQLSFNQQEWLYAQTKHIDLDSFIKENVLSDGAAEKSTRQKAFDDLQWEWNVAEREVDFNRPTKWMQKASEIVLSAIELNRWGDMQKDVAAVNQKFLAFLQESYLNIVSSTCGDECPRIVTQVLPFINKQEDEKSALVVIDGMNYWQALLLTRSLEEHLNIRAKYDCIYSWLPSVTELSRQAIFRGDIPEVDYAQSPASEKKLWMEFWDSQGLPSFQQLYQHSGVINEAESVKRLGYVSVDLDEKMHASDNYMYLYDATRRWVEEEEILGNIRHLIERGFKVYITTDHGNIETTAYRKLDSRDKLGANLSLRHITLPKEADKGLFEAEYAGHIVQVDSASKTYYAREKEAFTSDDRCVTHGGTHWLEVLIPFITLEK